MSVSADVVLFAIRASIRIAGQVRQAYVDNLRRRELVLPLPDFPSQPDETSALNYFEGSGAKFVGEDARVKQLFEKALDVGAANLSDAEKEEFGQLYLEYRLVADAEAGKYLAQRLSGDGVRALLKIRQWHKDPAPTPLRRIAGTLVEIGVDYYAQVPGALNENSAHAKALKGFFTAIDDQDFVDTNVHQIATGLFVAAVETINDNPQLLTGDEKTQELVQTITKGLAKDVDARLSAIPEGDLDARERVVAWSQLIFRSVLEHGGGAVLADPGKFLGTKEGVQSDAVSTIGTGLLDFVLSDVVLDDGSKINFDALFSKNALDRVVKSALTVVAEHPELAGDNEGVRKIVGEVASALSKSPTQIGTELLPEAVQLVLEKTAGNLDVLWPDIEQDPKGHLLIVGVREVLEALANADAPGRWKPRITHGEVMSVLDAVLDEIVENPAWVLEKAGEEGTPLRDVADAVFVALATVPENRISTKTGLEVLRVAITAVAVRKQFLDTVSVGAGEDRKRLLTLAIESVFQSIAGDDANAEATWVLARSTAATILVDVVLTKLAEIGVTEDRIDALKTIITDATQKLAQGGEFSIETVIDEIEALAA
jgi:hypothetical protein